MDPTQPGFPLPIELPTRPSLSAMVRGAYSVILEFEKKQTAIWNQSPGDGSRRKNLMWVRVVGYLLLEGPSDRARIAVALEVNSCAGDGEKIIAIGKYYCDYYLCACKLSMFLLLRDSERTYFNSQEE